MRLGNLRKQSLSSGIQTSLCLMKRTGGGNRETRNPDTRSFEIHYRAVLTNFCGEGCGLSRSIAEGKDVKDGE